MQREKRSETLASCSQHFRHSESVTSLSQWSIAEIFSTREAPKAQLPVTLTVGVSTRNIHTSDVNIFTKSMLKSKGMYV